MERIAKPFEQACRNTAAHCGGSGLGLPLVKALAELHGGSLSSTASTAKASPRRSTCRRRKHERPSSTLLSAFPHEEGG